MVNWSVASCIIKYGRCTWLPHKELLLHLNLPPIAGLLGTHICCYKHNLPATWTRRTGTNCWDKCSRLRGFAVVWAWSRPCLSQPLLAVIHTPHTLCSDLTRGKAPTNPHSLSSKIHKGKVLNDFLSLPVFTACCPHPPCLLPVRQRKSGGIAAEVAAGSQSVRVCVRWCLCSCGVCACTIRRVGRHGGRRGAIGQGDEWTVTCWCCTKNVRRPPCGEWS